MEHMGKSKAGSKQPPAVEERCLTGVFAKKKQRGWEGRRMYLNQGTL